MRKPFYEILHPAEVKGAQRGRYWIAVGGWFFLVVLLLMLFGVLGYLLVIVLETNLGADALRAYEMWALAILLALMGGSIFLGDYLWGLLFIKTGFLSSEAVIRISTNRAPTVKGEKIHSRISFSLSILIPLFLIGVGWYLHSWWFMALAGLLGVWLFISVWAGWKNADALIAGDEPLPSELDGVPDDPNNPKKSG
jgi:hypothetical protein